MLNILVVEDDKNTRKLITTILKNHGYTTLEAVNGVEALEMLEHNHVDLMVLDVMMPQMDGYELAQTLRDGGSQMPMLMLSAKSKADDIKQGFVVGIDDYMTKPFDFEELLLRIKALLRRSKIVAENKLVVGKITLHFGKRRRNASAKGISAVVQAAVLSRKGLYPFAAYGRNLGHGRRKRRSHGKRAYQPVTYAFCRNKGIRNRNGKRLGIQGGKTR